MRDPRYANPVKDQVAIVGVGSTGFATGPNGRSRASLVLRAAVEAIRDAGLVASDIDGVCGTALPAPYVVSALGLAEVTHHGNQQPPFGFTITDAVNAIYAGACSTVLVYHIAYRSPAISRAAASDPLRANLGFAGSPAPPPGRHDPEVVAGAAGYAAWAGRYFHESGARREHLGHIALNSRANAHRNPRAAKREPMTMTQYLAAPLVSEPLGLLDLDVPVDGADAFILTSAERARHLVEHPVLVHATASGISGPADEDQLPGLRNHGQHVVRRTLQGKSDLWLSDIDVFYPYDGSTFLALSWIENLGWCGFGEGGAFLESHRDPAGRLLIEGRIPVNTHGGGLSEGATQGSGHVREAVEQLRGSAGIRQVPRARSALLVLGGFFVNAQGLVLRRD